MKETPALIDLSVHRLEGSIGKIFFGAASNHKKPAAPTAVSLTTTASVTATGNRKRPGAARSREFNFNLSATSDSAACFDSN